MGQDIPGTCSLLQSDFLGKETPSPALCVSCVGFFMPMQRCVSWSIWRWGFHALCQINLWSGEADHKRPILEKRWTGQSVLEKKKPKDKMQESLMVHISTSGNLTEALPSPGFLLLPNNPSSNLVPVHPAHDMANTITFKDGREIVLSPKAATVLSQCPNWALVRFLVGFTIISLPTILLDDVPTVDKRLPYIQAHIQVQLSANGQHQNSHHPLELIHSNVSCPQWPLQKERMKSFAICCWNKTFKWSSLDRAGFVCLVGQPPLLHKWDCCGSRNHPSSPASTVGPNNSETPRQLHRSSGLPESVTCPFHPLLNDDIKWKAYALGRQ